MKDYRVKFCGYKIFLLQLLGRYRSSKDGGYTIIVTQFACVEGWKSSSEVSFQLRSSEQDQKMSSNEE